MSLPILGFGTAAVGRRLNTREAVVLYEKAFGGGITYFDTAPEFAGYGKAQIQWSHLLKQVRPRIFPVIKCYEPDVDRALWLLERSLKELGTTLAVWSSYMVSGLTRWIRGWSSAGTAPTPCC